MVSIQHTNPGLAMWEGLFFFLVRSSPAGKKNGYPTNESDTPTEESDTVSRPRPLKTSSGRRSFFVEASP